MLRDLDLSGGDAGIVSRDFGTAAGALLVEDTCLGDTARGIQFEASAELVVKDTVIKGCLWNGISITHALAHWDPVTVWDVVVEDVDNIGVLFVDSFGIVDDASVSLCQGAGIVGIRSQVIVTDSLVWWNHAAGIALLESTAYIGDNDVWTTVSIQSGPYEDHFGDGVAMCLCPSVTLSGNTIRNSERAGVSNFGSYLTVDGNTISCAAFELVGEVVSASYFGPGHPPQDVEYTFFEGEPNVCGCPPGSVQCGVQSPDLEPPKPIP